LLLSRRLLWLDSVSGRVNKLRIIVLSTACSIQDKGTGVIIKGSLFGV